MAWAFDNSDQFVDSYSGSGTENHSFTVGTGDDRLLTVCIQTDSQISNNITGVSYNGTSMTNDYDFIPITGSGDNRVYVYHLLNPSSGANNIEVSHSGGISDVAVCAQSYENVDSFDTKASNTGTASNIADFELDITTAADNEFIVFFYGSTPASWDDANTVSPATRREYFFGVSSGRINGSGNDQDAASSGTHTVAIRGSALSPGASEETGLFALAFKQTGGVSAERAAELHGVDTTSAERAAEVSGGLEANAERAAELAGQDTVTADRSAEAHGSSTANAERSAETTGGLAADAERSAELTGEDTANATRSAETHGQDTASSERGAEASGSAGANAERAAETHGVDTDSAQREAEVHGQQTASAERSAELEGESNQVTSERAAEVHGVDSTSAERAAEVTGQGSASAERSAEVEGSSPISLTAAQDGANIDLTWTYNP